MGISAFLDHSHTLKDWTIIMVGQARGFQDIGINKDQDFRILFASSLCCLYGSSQAWSTFCVDLANIGWISLGLLAVAGSLVQVQLRWGLPFDELFQSSSAWFLGSWFELAPQVVLDKMNHCSITALEKSSFRLTVPSLRVLNAKTLQRRSWKSTKKWYDYQWV